MKLVATSVPDIPPLAWLCILPRGGRAELRHGGQVDLLDDGFFEGAWAGPFAEAGFDRVTEVCGSGGKRTPDGMVFVAPSHSIDALYVLSDAAGRAVSNSLPFLLAQGELELDPADWSYGRLFTSIMDGVARARRTIQLGDRAVDIVCFDNILVDAEGGLSLQPKPISPGFPDYRAYEGHLMAVVSALFDNAADPARRCRYTPLVTVSSGYDSPACAAVAKRCGCREAVTFRTARGGHEDSGRAVAEALGLAVEEFDWTGPNARDDGSEDEFLATGMQGEDYVFSVLEPILGGRLLVTGFHGGYVWDRYRPTDKPIIRHDISGTSLGEFRLARNFLHLPLPFIGCRNVADLRRISNSEEMRPYEIAGGYDEPIARRLAEEAGAPRAAFGRKKRAVSIHMFRHPALLSNTARREIQRYRKTLRIGPARWLAYGVRAALWRLGFVFNMTVGKLMRRAGLGRVFASVFGYSAGPAWVMFEHAHPRNTIWLNWALARVKRRYAPACAGSSEQQD